jgi:cysteine desulfurase
MKKIYFDNSATTCIDNLVLKEMIPYYNKYFGNPSSLHSYGIDASNAVDNSRKQIAEILNAKQDEIIFTSGGTESDNLAIKGIADNFKEKIKTADNHIITSSIEHPAVIETCRYLEKQGYNVKYLPVDKYGMIKIEDLKNAITKNTFLITIMYANNEIGTIEPIKDIGKIARKFDIIFHTDAVQAICKIPINIKELNIDLLSISSHKIYGPKGIGALFIRNGIKISPIIHGGGHERNIRSGTLNTPGIVGLGKACEIGQKRMKKDIPYIKYLRDTLIENLLKIKDTTLNGHPTKRLVNNAHFTFKKIEGESLLMMLDEKGIATSTGSACSSEKQYSSHVLREMGFNKDQLQSSLRLTLGRENNIEEIIYASELIPKIVKNLRKISPL